MSLGYLHKPPGAGRRVTTTHPPDPQMATHVGYLRLNHLSPYAGSAGWPDWELPFIQWAEREGYALDVVTNADLEDHPGLLAERADGYRLFLSVGHDEYWSGPMRDTVEAFIGRGGNAAFFSGNTSFWQVRIEDHPEGPAASMVGYKGRFKDDPCYGTERVGELTSIWSDHLIGRSENQMTGVSFARGGYHRIGKRATSGAGGYTIHRPDHWLFDETGIGYGDLLGAGRHDGRLRVRRLRLHVPRRSSVPNRRGRHARHVRDPRHGAGGPLHPRRLRRGHRHPTSRPRWSSSPPRLFDSRGPDGVTRIEHGHAVLGSYTSPGGGTVVTSGSTDWAHGLAGRDPQVEQITRNVLTRLSAPRVDAAAGGRRLRAPRRLPGPRRLGGTPAVRRPDALAPPRRTRRPHDRHGGRGLPRGAGVRGPSSRFLVT